jgi:glycosyltransferase involved in cell wall biosynthesis
MEILVNIGCRNWRVSETIDRSQTSATVVICTHNRPFILERCLQALQNVECEAVSIIIVDSAPTSNAAWILSQRYQTDYVVSPMSGLSRARNIGARAARGDIIAFLDDDMVPHRGWLAALVERFVDDRVAAVTGPVLPLQAREVGADELRQMIEACSCGPSAFEIRLDSPSWFERANFGGVGDGNFALRRDAFGRGVEFEEGLGRGETIDSGEEHYLFFRLVALRYRVNYEPRAIVFHPVSPLDAQHPRELMAQSCAYAIFLAWHHPRYAWRIAKYYIGGIFGVRRRWRNPALNPRASHSRTAMLQGALAGLWLFLRSLSERRAVAPLAHRQGADPTLPSLHGSQEAGREVHIPTWTR